MYLLVNPTPLFREITVWENLGQEVCESRYPSHPYIYCSATLRELEPTRRSLVSVVHGCDSRSLGKNFPLEQHCLYSTAGYPWQKHWKGQVLNLVICFCLD